MTRQELIQQLVGNKKRATVFSETVISSTLATLSPLDLTSLTAAINAGDRGLIGSIVDTVFDKKKQIDAKAAINLLIINDKIDLDDLVLNLG